MKTYIPIALLLKAKSRLSCSILLVLSVSVIASTGLTEDLDQLASPSNTSPPVNTLQATIQLGAGVFPQAVVISPNSQTIYVASYGSSGGIVSVVDSQTDTLTTTIPVPGAINDVAITPDGSTLYVVSATNPAAVYVVSTATNAVTATLNMQGFNLAISPDGKEVYVTDGLQGISIIDTATNQVHLHAIPTPAGSGEIALTPDGQTAYVVTFSYTVQAIDLANGNVKATITLPSADAVDAYLTVGPSGKRLFISYDRARVGTVPRQTAVLQVDTSTNQVINTIGFFRNFDSANSGITPDGKYLYIPGAKLLMLDVATNKIPAHISVGGGVLRSVAVARTAPFACAVGSYGNNNEGAVYMLDISPE
jgi:DNA-binding beta-propeller fold protein YncE